MQIFVFLAEGFEETEAIAPVDVFRRAGLKVAIVSVTGELNVCGAHGICVLADSRFEDISFEGDFMIFLPGGMPGTANLDNHAGLKRLIELQAEGKNKIAAICAAPSILGKMGLLENKEAVCYPGFETSLHGASVPDARVVVSDEIYTAKGPGVAVEFALRIVENVLGKEVSDRVAEAMIVG